MTNKYLEKISEQYTDKQHAARHSLGVYGLASSKLRKRETVGGWLRTQGRATLEGSVGQAAGGAAGGALGHVLSRGRSPVAVVGGAVSGGLAGGVGGIYHGSLSSIRNRIAAGKLKDVKDTSKK